MVDCIGKCLAIARKPRINQRKSAAGFYGELINIIFYYLSNWCTFFSELAHEKFGNQLIGNVVQCFMPFIFVLFGKSKEGSS